MRPRVQRWGRSLALRIPNSLAAQIGLTENRAVDLSVVDGCLVVQPRCEEPLRLRHLLRGITGVNVHGEWETGRAVGNETW